MAAYASVVSLMNLVDQTQQHQALRRQIHFHGEQIQALRQSAEFLQHFLEGYSHGIARNEAEILEGQIVSAAVAVQDVIKSHMLDQVRAACTRLWGKTSVSLFDIKQMVSQVDSIKAKVMKIQEKATTEAHSSFVVNSNTSSVPPNGKTADIVGFDEEVIEIMDKLTGQPAARLVIPIVGMGGIGKTTLAKAVYENRLIVEYFDIRIWISVSHQFSIKQIFLQAFMALNPQHNIDGSESVDWLGERVYKTLWGRRYLIVMDDIWSIEAWEKVRRFFPENNSGAGIRMTSRLSNMGDYFGAGAFKMQFLGDDKSWKLFCVKAFGSHSCPPEFEKNGKKIVGKCRGLPLSIVVIGGLLAKCSRTQNYWESVEKDMNSILSSENDEQCLNILSLSYQHLPVYLKPCFLHLGIFEEDQMVRASTLIRLWVAEGFLKPNEDKSMEEVARDCLRDLIDRNLILKNRDNTFSIHDLLREVSLRIARREKFFSVISMHSIAHDKACEFFKGKSRETAFTRKGKSNRSLSLLCYKYYNPILVNHDFRMVRGHNIDYSTELFPYKLLSFPYLHFCRLHRGQPQRVLPLLYSFWNLQTLIFTVDTCFFHRSYPTIDIWKMPQIRHILVSDFLLPDPPSSRADESVLETLQTLGVVENFSCTEQVVIRIPNIKYLKIKFVDSIRSFQHYCLDNVGRFHKLETFICEFPHTLKRHRMHILAFPTSLKNLCLLYCKLDWTDLKLIGELPDLEFLKLECCNFMESELKIVEGGFRSLKCFQVRYSELTHWTVNSSQDFPILERFCLKSTRNLSEIPNAIADIPTLNLILLIDCPASVVVSAVNILGEQLSNGNEDLHLEVYFPYGEGDDSFREMFGSEDLESYQNNFEIFVGNPYDEAPWKWELDEDEDHQKWLGPGHRDFMHMY